MRGNELLYKLELVNPAFLEAAEEQPRRKRAVWLQWGGAAACLCVIAAAVFAFGTGRLPNPNPGGVAPGPAPSQDASPAIEAETAVPIPPSTVYVDMDKIFVNESEDLVSASLLYFDPALYEEVRWDKETVAAYYGRPLAPTWVPEGLTPTNPDCSARVNVRREDGKVVYDTVALGYYRQFGAWEDGSPRFIDQRCVQQGFQITVSRLGQHGCCVYLGPEDEVEWSDIAGTPVAIGYRAMSHGPYDPDTHEPAGYYDLYVAQFTLDGISFQIVADEMALEDVVKVAASIICPDREIALEYPGK